MMQTFLLKLKFELLTIDLLFAVVSIGQAVVSIGVSVGVGSVGVREGGVVVGSIAVVTYIESRVVQPGVSLGVSLSLGSGLGSRLGLSLLHRDGRGLLNSSSGRGSHNSGGYETSMGAGDKSSIIVGASSIGHHMGVGQSIGKSVVGIGVGEDTGGGVGKGRVSLGLSAGRGSEGYHQQELHVDDLRQLS